MKTVARKAVPLNKKIAYAAPAYALAAAVGVGAGLSILGAAGYTPNVEQSEQVKLVFRTLYALVPSVYNLIAILIALAYPISSKVHENIRKAIDDRNKGMVVVNPMKPMSSTA